MLVLSSSESEFMFEGSTWLLIFSVCCGSRVAWVSAKASSEAAAEGGRVLPLSFGLCFTGGMLLLRRVDYECSVFGRTAFRGDTSDSTHIHGELSHIGCCAAVVRLPCDLRNCLMIRNIFCDSILSGCTTLERCLYDKCKKWLTAAQNRELVVRLSQDCRAAALRCPQIAKKSQK